MTNQNPTTTSGTHQRSDRPEGTDVQAMPGRNTGMTGDFPERDARTAYEVKELNRQLHGFTDDELRQIPVIPEGQRLAQGATYYDIRNPGGGEFTARGDESVGRDAWVVPKRAVEAQLWNRLIGVTNPERRGEQ